MELPVAAHLDAAEEAGFVVAEREAIKGVAAGEGAADMAADIEAGPVVKSARRNRRRGFAVIGAGAEMAPNAGAAAANAVRATVASRIFFISQSSEIQNETLRAAPPGANKDRI